MRILVVSSYAYWGGFTPADLKSEVKQVGGGETAMISIAKGLADLGNEVIVFYDIAEPGRYDKVDYLPTALYPTIASQLYADVIISWDNPYVFRFTDRAARRVLALQLNDAFIGPFDHVIDLYMHPSKWHIDMFHKHYPEMTKSKSIAGLTNGIDVDRYIDPELKGQAVRNPKRVIYSSSPDRGLHHLLRMWPKIIRRVPDAELHIFYDLDRWLEVDAQITARGHYNVTHERAELVREYRKQGLPNTTFHGGVGQGRLAREQLSSGVMVYPCDPVRPTEGFSMTVLEGIAAGCQVVISDADAFPELWSDNESVTMLPLPIDDAVWIDAIVDKLTHPSEDVIRLNMSLAWPSLAQRWERELLKCLKARH